MITLTNASLIQFAAWRYIVWADLITDLDSAGWDQASVARTINVPPTTLSGWFKEGAEPRYSNGEALLNLYRAVFGDAHTENRITSFRKAAIKLPATG